MQPPAPVESLAVLISKLHMPMAKVEEDDSKADAVAPTATVAPTPVALQVSPIAAETGFDFGVPGCHRLPITSNSSSMDGAEDGSGSESDTAASVA